MLHSRCVGLDCCPAMPDKRERYWPVLNDASLFS